MPSGSPTTGAVASRPPVSLTSLVGRERELADLSALVKAQRLVTLTGVGGSGKTRLAAELALRLDWQQPASVAWVELAACSDPALVPQRVAATLDVRAAPDGGTVDALVDALRDRELVLVLDDCEHLIAGCADLARALLTRCARLHILVTSREPLGVPGEHIWPIPPIAAHEAAQLFAERAAAVDPAFSLTPENAEAVGEVCRRLDAIPLAIELAAARVRVLTPSQIAAKLEDRFAILTGGSRTAIARHRTLRAAVDWSFDLLSREEQTLLARLSVFAGSFSLEDAQSVCDATLDQLTSLVDKSLLVTTRRRGAVRYYLLETIRQYGAERLADSGESCALRRKHALAFLAVARGSVIDPMCDVTARLAALDGEHDNIRAALVWSIEQEPDAIALPLGAVFRWYWYYRILWGEGLRWLEQVIERSSPAPSPDRAAVLAGAGVFAAYLGELQKGRRHLDEAERMWRDLGDERELAVTLSALAQLLANCGELDQASARAAECVTLARRAGTSWDLAYCLTNGAAFVAQKRGDLEAADRALAEAEAIWTPSRHPLGVPFVLSTRAVLAVRRNDPEAAARFARAALVAARAAGEMWFSARALRVLAFTNAQNRSRATTLLAASDAMLRSMGARLLVHEAAEHDGLMATLRGSMPQDEFESALREGSSMGCEAACDFALADDVVETQPLLHVSDLGPLQITLGGKPLPAEGANRARELLVFLLAHAPGPTKEEVGVAFWPDASTDQVKNSFHVTLHRLRKLLGASDAVIVDGARYVVAMPHATASQQFELAITAALRTGHGLEDALSLYEGDFLQGEDAGEWCLPIRARLRQLYLRGLFALGGAHEARGRYVDACEAYTRVLAREPFHEAAARQLMICHARLGARSESLLVYRRLEERLRDDLQAAPEPETSTLYRRLRQNESV